MCAARSLYAVVVVGALLSGCSVRPLPQTENESPLPVFNIVHQIQCEAATAVRAAHQRRGFNGLSKELEKLKKRVAAASKAVSAKRLELAEKSDFGTRLEELLDATSFVLLKQAQNEQARARIQKSNQDDDDKNRALQVLHKEKDWIDQQRGNVNAATIILRDLDRLGKIYKAVAAELAAKRFEEVIAFEAHTAAFHFEFEITEDNNLSSTGSVTWPVVLGALAGTFTMGYDVGDKRQRLAKRTVKLATSFGEFVSSFEKGSDGEKLYCRDVAVPAPDIIPRSYPMTGNIGLEGVVKEYLAMLKSGKFKSGGEGYTDKIQFTTTMNGSLKPGIDLARKPGPTIKASGVIEGIRKDVHVLTISLTPREDSEKSGAVQQVEITQIPAVRVRPDVLRFPPLN